MTLNLRYIEIEPAQFFNDPRGHPNQQHEPRKLVFPFPSRAVNLQRNLDSTLWTRVGLFDFMQERDTMISYFLAYRCATISPASGPSLFTERNALFP